MNACKISIVADHVHPLMEMVFPDGSHTNALCHITEMAQVRAQQEV